MASTSNMKNVKRPAIILISAKPILTILAYNQSDIIRI